jgi:glucokinase
VIALSADLGGGHVTCAVVGDHEIVAARALLTDKTAGLRPLLPVIADTLHQLLGSAGFPVQRCAGLALSVCGLVDSSTARIISTNAKYDDAPEVDLPGWCQEAFHLPLRAENDARMALLGEWHAGAGAGFSEIVMMTLGTGVGGAAMIGGRLLRGKHFQAGCLGGHFPIAFDGRRCTCGSRGCVEAEASAWSLPDVCRSLPGFERSRLAAEPEITFENMFRLAHGGDAVARLARDRCLAVWGAGAIALIHAYDPEIVLLGGGVMKSAATILPFMRSCVDQHAWTPWGRVEVHSARLGNDAALLGAIPLLSQAGLS